MLPWLTRVNNPNGLSIGLPVSAQLTTESPYTDGRELVWADEIRYLGVFIVHATKFKCSVDQAKRSFYRASNSIFARVGRLASE